jgi:hypothetical protein
MIQAKTTVSLLLAGLMAGGAWAQTASATSDVPVKAGEASTMTQGQPNMATQHDPMRGHGSVGSATSAPLSSSTGVPVDSAASPSSTAVMGAPSAVMSGSGAREVPHHSATVTTNVPTKAGEASTMTNGVPNMRTDNPNPDGSRLLTPPVLKVDRVPQSAGEASTMIGGRPNANPDDPVYRR